MTVFYVAGTMRSGTTALGQALVASPDLVLLGEIRPMLLAHAEPAGGRCDCGETGPRCRFWSRAAALPDVSAAAARAFRTTALPGLFATALGWRRPSPAVAAVVDRLRTLAALAGDHVVVDTSKTAAGVLLWRLAGQDVVVAQAVRSPWVVAAKQAATTSRSGLPQTPWAASLAVWVIHHLATLFAGRLPGVRRHTVAYGRFVADPAREVRALWALGDVRPGRVDRGGRFAPGLSHLQQGNPRRERGGGVTVGPRAVRRSGAYAHPSSWSRSSSIPKWCASSWTTVTRISYSSSSSSSQ